MDLRLKLCCRAAPPLRLGHRAPALTFSSCTPLQNFALICTRDRHRLSLANIALLAACCSSFFLFLLRCRYASRQKLFCEQFTPTAFLKFPGQTFLAFYYNKASDVCAGAGHRRNVLSVFCNIEKTIMITSSLNYGPAGFVIRVAGILFPRRCRFNNKQFP